MIGSRSGIRLAILASSLAAGAASGSVITLDAAARGWLQTVPPFNNGDLPSNNYIAGFCGPSDCVSHSGEFRDFFEFAIPDFSGAVVGARLLLDTGDVFTPDPSETYQVTSIPTVFSFADLGTGAMYGSRVYFPSDSGTNQAITLNDAALAAIVPSTTFGVGGRVTTLSGQMAVDEHVFGSTQFVATSRLEITTITVVPEPAAWIGLAPGLAALGWRSRAVSGLDEGPE